MEIDEKVYNDMVEKIAKLQKLDDDNKKTINSLNSEKETTTTKLNEAMENNKSLIDKLTLFALKDYSEEKENPKDDEKIMSLDEINEKLFN